MRATVSIDKAGRLVIPKPMRQSLHLEPGTLLTIEQSDDRLTLAPAIREAQLAIVDGTPLISPAGDAAAILTNETVLATIAQGRRQRERRLLSTNVDEPGE
jgi:AbrB family looped-hinge helix DNA binding protein